MNGLGSGLAIGGTSVELGAGPGGGFTPGLPVEVGAGVGVGGVTTGLGEATPSICERHAWQPQPVALLASKYRVVVQVAGAAR